jgi:hypothetical protein
MKTIEQLLHGPDALQQGERDIAPRLAQLGLLGHDRLVHVRPTRQATTDLHLNPERNTLSKSDPI